VLALMPLLRESRTLFLPEEDLRAIDPELGSFRNVNRPEDF